MTSWPSFCFFFLSLCTLASQYFSSVFDGIWSHETIIRVHTFLGKKKINLFPHQLTSKRKKSWLKVSFLFETLMKQRIFFVLLSFVFESNVIMMFLFQKYIHFSIILIEQTIGFQNKFLIWFYQFFYISFIFFLILKSHSFNLHKN